jgi:hypothetical protein
MFASRKKSLVAVLTIVAVAAAGTAAYAYWTAGGSGSGAGTAGSTVGLIPRQTTVLTAMYPGDAAQTISGNFDNSNDGPVYVTSVTASIFSVTKAVGAPAGTCDASDFTLASAVMAVGAQVPTGTGKGSFTGATIHFNNKAAANQDACQNATVNLSYAVA